MEAHGFNKDPMRRAIGFEQSDFSPQEVVTSQTNYIHKLETSRLSREMEVKTTELRHFSGVCGGIGESEWGNAGSFL